MSKEKEELLEDVFSECAQDIVAESEKTLGEIPYKNIIEVFSTHTSYQICMDIIGRLFDCLPCIIRYYISDAPWSLENKEKSTIRMFFFEFDIKRPNIREFEALRATLERHLYLIRVNYYAVKKYDFTFRRELFETLNFSYVDEYDKFLDAYKAADENFINREIDYMGYEQKAIKNIILNEYKGTVTRLYYSNLNAKEFKMRLDPRMFEVFSNLKWAFYESDFTQCRMHKPNTSKYIVDNPYAYYMPASLKVNRRVPCGKLMASNIMFADDFSSQEKIFFCARLEPNYDETLIKYVCFVVSEMNLTVGFLRQLIEADDYDLNELVHTIQREMSFIHLNSYYDLSYGFGEREYDFSLRPRVWI